MRGWSVGMRLIEAAGLNAIALSSARRGKRGRLRWRSSCQRPGHLRWDDWREQIAIAEVRASDRIRASGAAMAVSLGCLPARAGAGLKEKGVARAG